MWGERPGSSEKSLVRSINLGHFGRALDQTNFPVGDDVSPPVVVFIPAMTRAASWFVAVALWLTFSLNGVQAAGTHPNAEEAGSAAAAHTTAAHAEHHALPPAAVKLDALKIGYFEITNSMLVVWGVALVLIIVAQLATRKMSFVPSGLQNFVEWLVESLYSFLEGILGKDLVKKSFWFFATIFIIILFTNWFGLFPGVGTIGWGHQAANGEFIVTSPILRGGNADLNMTVAMSMIFFVMWTVWAVQTNGVMGVIKHLFGGDSGATGFMKVFLIVVFLAVGVLEVVSILFRPVALSLRLYGNIFAGENILESMINLLPWLGWALSLPFYFLELLVGLVQALVFTLLTAVFTALICEHHESGTAEHAGTGKAH